LEKSGHGVRQSKNILGDQWAKMIVNLNNGLNTLTGRPLRAGLVQRDYRRALALCVEEALHVAKANGVEVGQFNGRPPTALMKILRLPDFAYRIVMQLIVKIDAKARSSMLDDLEAGRESEIAYLQGEIVDRAAKAGLSAPHNAAILSAVMDTFEAKHSPQLSGTEILSLLKN
jgi:2-dehydropantoate 2-reductase